MIFDHDKSEINIYKDGSIIKSSKASAGLWDSFTPKGIFQIEKNRRGKWFYVERFNEGAKYWVGFKDSYLFHSIPMNKNKKIIKEEYDKLGKPASHGCIRLPLDLAKYIYMNVPDGSIVIIK